MADLGNVGVILSVGGTLQDRVSDAYRELPETGRFMPDPAVSLVPYMRPVPMWWVSMPNSRPGEPDHPNYNHVRPQGNFTTQVDGIDTPKPVMAMANSYPVMMLPVSQPTEFNFLPAEAVEFVVMGEGVKQTETWGPYTLVRTTMTLTGSMPDGQVSVAYSSALTAAGLAGVAVWTQTGTLPPGLSHTDGVVSGTPTLAGTYRFSISVRDPFDSAILYRDFTVTIAP